MPFGHEQLDVYKLALHYVAWVFGTAADLKGSGTPVRDQWLRASQSIPLNIAEGNGKYSDADRRRFFEIARGSALECAAIQDVLEVSGQLNQKLNQEKKSQLERVVAMLTRLGGRRYSDTVHETSADYGSEFEFDTDVDSGVDSDVDSDTESESLLFQSKTKAI